MVRTYFVYILASAKNGTLYIGITNNLQQRVIQHKTATGSEFVQKYSIKRLVYFEQTESAEAAIVREKRLKKWPRQWKLNIIEASNPNWQDLSGNFL